MCAKAQTQKNWRGCLSVHLRITYTSAVNEIQTSDNPTDFKLMNGIANSHPSDLREPYILYHNRIIIWLKVATTFLEMFTIIHER